MQFQFLFRAALLAFITLQSSYAVDFTLSIAGSRTVMRGYSTVFAVKGTITAGVDESAYLKVTGLPAGAEATWWHLKFFCCKEYAWRIADTDQPVQITVPSSVGAGVYPITVSYTSFSGVTRTATFPLQVVDPPQSPAVTLPANVDLPEIAVWRTNMAKYGNMHCNPMEMDFSGSSGAWYYDGARVYENIARLLSQESYFTCAQMFNTAYRQYVENAKGWLPGYRYFPHGLTLNYQRTGDPLSKAAVILMSDKSPWAQSSAVSAWMIDPELTREIAYATSTIVYAERLGSPRTWKLPFLVDCLLAHFERWFVQHNAKPQPFMVALAAEALIDYYDLTKDPRIPGALKLAADGLWISSWDPVSKSFLYEELSNNTRWPSNDTNLLIVPIYGWVFQHTGESIYRERGDFIFANGVKTAWLDGGKQFSQNYRWSDKYVEWRQSATQPPPTPSGPSSLTVVSGSPQSATVATAFGVPVVVAVKDAKGNPVSGVNVTFTAPAAGASATFAGGTSIAATTNSGGLAAAAAVANATAGSYQITASISGLPTVSFAMTNTAVSAPPGPTGPTGVATFVKADIMTSGTWKGVYGVDGYNIVGDTASYPSYVTATTAGNETYVWSTSTTDERGLQKISSTTDRVAGAWYSDNSFKVDLSFSDKTAHQVAVYIVDWDALGSGRKQRIDIVDSNNNVLDTRTISAFTSGQYVIWNLSGRVSIRVTNTNPAANAVVAGIFFGGAGLPNGGGNGGSNGGGNGGSNGGGNGGSNGGGNGSATASVAFVKADTSTGGSWKGVYGADGYNVIGSILSYPSYVTATPSGHSSYQWVYSTSDPRALFKGPSASDRLAACWTSTGAFKIDLNFADQTPHQVALYMSDWDNYNGGRVQKVEIVDSNDKVLDTRTVSQFGAGQYLVWNLGGRVSIRITNMNPASNAVVSGIFFGSGGPPPASAPGTAAFVKTDTSTGGAWKGVYGADGYNIIGSGTTYPSYVSVNSSGYQTYQWTTSTPDARALQKAASAADRLVACWYTSGSFTIDLSFNDQNSHQVALYLLDWDGWGGGRKQKIEILDQNGKVLDTQTVSAFAKGEYLVWNLSGRVSIRIANTNPVSNALVNGIFFR